MGRGMTGRPLRRPGKLSPVKRLTVLVLAAALAAVSCSASSPVLDVDGRTLSRSDLFDELASLERAARDAGVDTSDITRPGGNYAAVFVAGVLNIEVQLSVVDDVLDELGVTVGADDIEARTDEIRGRLGPTQLALAPILGELLAKQQLADPALADLEVSEADRRAAYERNPELWANLLGEQLCASHILHDTEADALASLAELDAGADFADVARRSSTGPSGPDGGDLGCAPRGSYVPEFEDAAYAASDGEIIGPVESQFGFHVILVSSVGGPSFETVGVQLSSIIEANPSLFPLLLADVDVDARFGRWDRSRLQVVAPDGP